MAGSWGAAWLWSLTSSTRLSPARPPTQELEDGPGARRGSSARSSLLCESHARPVRRQPPPPPLTGAARRASGAVPGAAGNARPVRVASRARSQRGEGAGARPGGLQWTGAAERGARNFAAAEIWLQRQPTPAGAGGRGRAGVPRPESLGGGGVFPPRWPEAAGHSRLLLLRLPSSPPAREIGRASCRERVSSPV